MDIEDENDTPKPRLNRQVLEHHGITYSEEVHVDQALLGLPEHVALLAEFLLDFEGLLEISSRPVLENEFRNHTGNARPPHIYGPPAESTYFQAHEVNTRRSERNKAIDEAELKQKALIAEGARWLEENRKSEDDWVFYLRVNVFKAFEQHQDTSSEPSRYGKLFDRWSMEQNNLWDGFRNRGLEPGITQPTLPKPDLTFAYPIIEHRPEMSKGLWRDESATNFTVDTLCALWNDRGLRSSPKANLARLGRHGNKAGKLVCFPWAVVEIKPAVQAAEFCHCQAANGASCALEIYEGLIEQATGKLDDDFPLVIAFTTGGPGYKVWLSYSSTKRRGQKCHTMVCIWEHSMGTTWGLIALQHIVQNMQLWAFRVLRPRVSHYISQCRKRSAQDSSTDDDPSDPQETPPRTPGSSGTSEPQGPADASGGSEPSESPELPDLPEAPDSLYKPSQTFESSGTSGLVAAPELSETLNPQEAPELPKASEPTVISEPAVTASERRSSPSTSDTRLPLAERIPVSDDLTALPTIYAQSNVKTPPLTQDLPFGSSATPNRPIKIPRGRLTRFTLDGASVQNQTDAGKASSAAISASSSFRANVRSSSVNAQPTNPGADAFELQSLVRPTSAPLAATGEDSGQTSEHSDLENQHTPPPSSGSWSPRPKAAVTSQAYSLEDSTTQPDSVIDRLDDSSYVPSEAGSEHSGNTSRATWETQSQDPSTADEAEHDIESRPYHVYRLGDHDTRLDIAELSDTESDEPDDLSYVPSDTSSEESDSQFSAAPEAVSEANLLTREVIDGLETKALGALSGAQFIGLDSVKCRINCLKGTKLLDAIWRALERVLEPRSRPAPHVLQDILEELSRTLSLTSDQLLTAKDVTAGRKWEVIDEALQEMQKASEFRSVKMLRKALSLWSGDICLEILKPNLSDLLNDEWASMKREALVILMDERGPNDRWEEEHGNAKIRAAKPGLRTVST